VPVPTPISRWHRIALEVLLDEIGSLLAEDVVFESPVVHTPQQGKAVGLNFCPRGAGEVARRAVGGRPQGDSPLRIPAKLAPFPASPYFPRCAGAEEEAGAGAS
jgi:hypothetical protein